MFLLPFSITDNFTLNVIANGTFHFFPNWFIFSLLLYLTSLTLIVIVFFICVVSVVFTVIFLAVSGTRISFGMNKDLSYLVFCQMQKKF